MIGVCSPLGRLRLRWAALLLPLVLSAGCAGFGDRHPDGDRARMEGRQAELPGYTYGHGTGETPEAARRAALQEIAGEVVTAVRAQQQEVFRSLRRRGEIPEDEAELTTEMELTAVVASLTHVELEGAELDAEVRIRDGWYVRMRMPSRRMESLRDQARRNAPALAQFEIVEGVPEGEPGRRFRLALRGLETARRTGVVDRRLYTPEIGETTFGSYFEETARRAAARLQVIPLVDGEEVRFAVVDRETLQPQPGFAIRVGHRELVADSGGVTAARRIAELADATRVTALGEPGTEPPLAEGARRIDTLHPDAWRGRGPATLYVHTAPPEAIIEVDGVQYATPARVPLRRRRSYTLHIYGTEEYRAHSERVVIPADGPAAYRSVVLTERRYGHVDLSADGRHSLIRLHGPETVEAAAVRRLLETGRYQVVVHRNEDRRYQMIVDEIVLRRDERVTRRYAEPIDRRPYHHGWRWALSLVTLGGAPGDEYQLPWYGGATGYGELEETPDARAAGVRSVSRSQLNILFGLQGQYFADLFPVTVSGGFGWRMENFEIEYEGGIGGRQEEEVGLTTTQAALGAGLWRPVGQRGAAGWVTANRAWESSGWSDREGAAAGLPGGSVENVYDFVEIGIHGRAFGASLRLGGADGAAGAALVFSYGATLMRQGFRHPPRVHAQDGVHY